MNRLNAILNWSMRVGRVFGIPVSLHISLLFFLLPVMSGRGGLGIWRDLEYVVAVVFSILLHELGHALAAKRFRLSGLSITLHGFGGFAVAGGYRTPNQQLVISLAGPAVTFALGFLLLGIGRLGGRGAVEGTEASIQFFIVAYLGSMNLLMGILNLLPSFPFDGGNSLRAILNNKMTEGKATRAVGHIGLVLSLLLGIYGLFTDQNFVAIFGVIGLIASYTTLMNTGGVRFREVVADRRAAKEMAAVRKREAERQRAYLDDVISREKERKDRERLRKILEDSLEDPTGGKL